jgi:hypothetical protein
MTRASTPTLIFATFCVTASVAVLMQHDRASADTTMGGTHVCALEDGVTWASEDGGCKDLITGLVWSTPNMGNPGAWSQGAAEQLVNDSSEGGHSDWRLPTVAEMQTVAANGASTHFSTAFACVTNPDGTFARWSSERQGKKHYATNVCNGSTDLYWSGGPAISYLSFVGVREGSAPPDPCNNNGICESGEDCENCDDCAGVQNGPPSGRYCCGNGVEEPAEGDGSICDGNH